MNRNKKSLIGMLCAVVFLAVLVMPAICAAEEMTITGQVSEEGTIVTDSGDEYTIADNDQKDELMENAGKKVTVMGAVTEDEGTKTVSVSSYEVIEE